MSSAPVAPLGAPVAPPRALRDRVALLFAQWFGSGLSPVAPGTVGALATLPLYFLLREVPASEYWLVVTLITLAGVVASEYAARALGEDDPSSVVIDEVAGVLIALGLVRGGPIWIEAAAWLLFRLFDITKPGVIDRAQYLEPAGVGIMADDVLAGFVAGGLALGLGAFFG